MIDLPKTIKLSGRSFTVKVGNLSDAEEEYGRSHAFHQEIILSSKLEGQQINQVLWHEVLHMALGIAGLDSALGEENEEAVVCALEYSLWPVVEHLARTGQWPTGARVRERKNPATNPRTGKGRATKNPKLTTPPEGSQA